MRAGNFDQRGLMLLGLLITVALASLAASTVALRWSDQMARENERELLVAGEQIAGAIAAYRRSSAGSLRKYPPTLDDLLEDRRAFGIVRHLRRVPPDPVNRGAAWGLVLAEDGGVMGVHSRSDAQPFLRQPLRLASVDVPVATRYSLWRFTPREDRR